MVQYENMVNIDFCLAIEQEDQACATCLVLACGATATQQQVSQTVLYLTALKTRAWLPFCPNS